MKNKVGQNNMIDERIYKLKNGEEKILMSYTTYENKRYLLLSDEKTESFQIAYEEDNKLIYLDKNDTIFNTVLSLLSEKLKKELD
jgi:hypothetical protein